MSAIIIIGIYVIITGTKYINKLASQYCNWNTIQYSSSNNYAAQNYLKFEQIWHLFGLYSINNFRLSCYVVFDVVFVALKFMIFTAEHETRKVDVVLRVDKFYNIFWKFNLCNGMCHFPLATPYANILNY